MDAQTNGYTYDPLNASEDIRLVILEPLPIGAPTTAPVKCTFVPVRFVDQPAYHALSYTWGSGNERQTIIVDGQVTSVTKNLWNALCGIREHDWNYTRHQPRRLWIDALCINQNDIKERNHQVRLMSDIYSQAEEVIAWLGEDDRLGPLAVDILESLEEDIQYENLKTRHWEALQYMTGLEYFYRMWIVQEVVLAQRLTIHCGSQSVDWSKLSKLFSYVESSPYHPYIEIIKRSQAMSLDRNRRSFQAKTLGLQALLRVCASCKCADPRDKVFALLGIASDCQDGELVADYSKDLFGVYKDVMLFWNPSYGSTDAYPKGIILSQILQRSFANSNLLEACAMEAINRPQENERRLVSKIYGQCIRIQALGPAVRRSSMLEILEYRENSDLLSSLTGVMALNSENCTAHVRTRSVPSKSRDRLHGAMVGQLFSGRKSPDHLKQGESLRLFRTSKGEIGVGPMGIASGDYICQSYEVNVVLRASLSSTFKVIGAVKIFSRVPTVDIKWQGPEEMSTRDWLQKQHKSDANGNSESKDDDKGPGVDLKLDILTTMKLTRYEPPPQAEITAPSSSTLKVVDEGLNGQLSPISVQIIPSVGVEGMNFLGENRTLHPQPISMPSPQKEFWRNSLLANQPESSIASQRTSAGITSKGICPSEFFRTSTQSHNHTSSQRNFFLWLAATRVFTHDSSITDIERRTCPLLYCRREFPDEKIMLRHVYQCRDLPSGLYWCYPCQKEESIVTDLVLHQPSEPLDIHDIAPNSRDTTVPGFQIIGPDMI